MPELPEVETIVRALRPHIEGRLLESTEAYDPALLPGIKSLSLPAQVRRLSRRGKYILIELGKGTLVVHLRMSGRLVWCKSGVPEGRMRLALRFPHGSVYLVDRRRLATVEFVERFEKPLGPEPFGDLSWLSCELAKSRMPIKAWLLDQRKIAGIGNIYAAEILFRAGIDPRRPARALAEEEVQRLIKAIPEVLKEAISGRGTTLADAEYRVPTGEPGAFQVKLAVYGREGEPCYACGTPIRRVKIAGRSTYFCPQCQR